MGQEGAGSRVSCIPWELQRWGQDIGVGLGAVRLIWFQLMRWQLLSWHGGLPACPPRAGQEVAMARDRGAPCLATASFTRCRLCHHRLTCKYKECPAHVNKPSYK